MRGSGSGTGTGTSGSGSGSSGSSGSGTTVVRGSSVLVVVAALHLRFETFV